MSAQYGELSKEEFDKIYGEYLKTRNLDLIQLSPKVRTEYSFSQKDEENIRKALERNHDINPLFDPVSDELVGDENYEEIILPDGRINEKYQAKVIRKFDAAKLVEKEQLPLKDVPAAIKHDAQMRALTGVGIFMLVLITYAFRFVYSPMLKGSFVIMVLLLISAWRLLQAGINNEFVKFEGIIVGVEEYGLTKTTRYVIVKMSDGEKFLNIKSVNLKDFKIGQPITVYLPPDLAITASKYGPLAEYILSYKLDISTDKTDELLSNGGISAADYINHDPVTGEIRSQEIQHETISDKESDEEIEGTISSKEHS